MLPSNKITSFHPISGQIISEHEKTDPKSLPDRIRRARAAVEAWAWRPFGERAEILKTYAQNLDKRKEAFRDLISAETGKPRWEAATEVGAMVKKIEISIRAHQTRCADFESPPGITRFRPHGVVGVLGPFNFPGHLPNGHIVPALLAGNAVLFKPSEFTPATGEFLVETLHQSGVPEDLCQILLGSGELGKALVEAPQIDGIFFTGSAQTGKAIREALIDSPGKILALEMGGNNPLVVWDVSDHESAALLTIQSAYLTAGQRCTCARRLFLPQDKTGDKILEHLLATIDRLRIGAPEDDPEPFMGPVIHKASADNLLAGQDALISKGGIAHRRMERLIPETPLLSPALIEMPLPDPDGQEEIDDTEYFGPLLQMYRVPDFETALHLANQTRYGLSAGLLSDSREHYDLFQRKIRAGLINWNQQLTGASSAAPFGGIGDSGNHRPSAFFAADYCSYPVASIENDSLPKPSLPGLR